MPKNIYRPIKRALDILLALLICIPALPIVAACYAAIKAETKGPAFFAQTRPGFKGKPFTLYKLRTMRVETHENGQALDDMQRMTKSGYLIRKFSLDELPQIYNILKGEMSFIGPRPLLPSYLPLYTPQQMRRHDVLPGISGWAQVNGRNELTWEQKFERDVWYVDNQSFALDVRIFFKTIWNVLHRSGINAGVSETMRPFEGTKKGVQP